MIGCSAATAIPSPLRRVQAPTLHIAAAIHQSFIEVNEEGTEAAAATGIGIGTTSSPMPFAANHPFLFVLYDNVTGSILFMGRVTAPRG